jgi:hypothetical protein
LTAAADVRSSEYVIGPFLRELGYDVTNDAGDRVRSPMTRAVFLNYFRMKRAVKVRTPFGRLTTNSRVWAEPPRPGERPVRQIPGPSDSELSAREGEVAIP